MLTFLGCGKLGTAILHGILSSQASPAPYGHPSQNIDALSESDNQTRYSFARFVACVQHHHSAERIRSSLSNWPDAPVSILVGQNLRGINDADVVILGTEPSAFLDVLDSDDVRRGLQGKILISILGGIRTADLQKVLLDPSHRLARMWQACNASPSPSLRTLGLLYHPLSRSSPPLFFPVSVRSSGCLLLSWKLALPWPLRLQRSLQLPLIR